ncbi:ATP-binding protein [Aphanothece hegewaldii CCALA 016]|uniref:ATP-binding protein n=1 Tax=Aphanothece hegewaldii CCALA 016 TaxID=2107694 RepID=A0A2T1LS21_9CHRO|nr:ATP-binding protein [Aphanothece hegewaldii]PSF32123.1 ATP-binding protein [Aphanothece hegewaldii CCALA 016]
MSFTKQKYRLRVKTELEALIPVLKWFEQLTENYSPKEIVWQCKLALAEGFTNTVRYAHDHFPPETPIDLELTLFSNIIEIRLWNFGEPFDLYKKLAELQNSSVDPLEKEGDRGLLFMNALMDELHYIRQADQRNCLMMRKNLSE